MPPEGAGVARAKRLSKAHSVRCTSLPICSFSSPAAGSAPLKTSNPSVTEMRSDPTVPEWKASCCFSDPKCTETLIAYPKYELAAAVAPTCGSTWLTPS